MHLGFLWHHGCALRILVTFQKPHPRLFFYVEHVYILHGCQATTCSLEFFFLSLSPLSFFFLFVQLLPGFPRSPNNAYTLLCT